MKNLKKVLALVLVVVMALGLITVSNAAFTDEATIEKEEAVKVLNAIGVIDGMPDGSFQPEGDVTRAQMAKMISLILNKGEDVGDLYKDACKFADVPASHWAAGHIAYCTQVGVINGRNDTTFDPEGKVTGTEAAKMVLCALNYDAKVEGFVGSTWASAVLAKAADVHLVGKDYNMTANMGEPLDRQNAAQLLLNGLKANMVDYPSTGTTITTSDGLTINTGASKAEPQTDTLTSATLPANYSYNNIGREHVYSPTAVPPVVPAAGDKFIIQLGEKMFPDLVKEDAAPDAFGRPAQKWTFENKDVVEAKEEATLVYKDKVKGGELYTALGKIATGDVYSFYYIVNGDTAHAQAAAANVAATTGDLVKIKSGNTGEIGQTGDVIEVYKNTSAKTIRIVQVNYNLAKINQVWAPVKDANGDVTTSGYVSLAAVTGTLPHTYTAADLDDGSTTQPNTVQTEAFAKADIGTYVVYTYSTDATAGTYTIQSVVKAEPVTGLFNSYVAGETVTIAGTTYGAYPNVQNGLTLNEEATAYLDPNGNAICIEGVESNNYAYLLKQATTGGVESTTEGILVLTDGTRKVVKLDTAGQTTPGNLYAYTVKADGTYKLSSAASVTASEPQPTAPNPSWTYSSNTVNLGFGNAKANANTVFIVETYDSAADTAVYATYTGIANVPNVTSADYSTWLNPNSTPTPNVRTYADLATSSAVAVTKAGDDYASFVFIFGSSVQSKSKDVTALYLTGAESVANDGNGNYYTVKAIVNGAETTVKVAAGASGVTIPAPGDPAVLVLTNNMNLDSNGYIAAVTPMSGADINVTFVDFAKDTTGVYSGTYADGVIVLVNGSAEETAFSVAESLPVYAYNTTTRTFQITTVGGYVPANGGISKLTLKMDTTQTPAPVAALYIIEQN